MGFLEQEGVTMPYLPETMRVRGAISISPYTGITGPQICRVGQLSNYEMPLPRADIICREPGHWHFAAPRGAAMRLSAKVTLNCLWVQFLQDFQDCRLQPTSH